MDTSSIPSTTGLRRRTIAVLTTVVLLFSLTASIAMAPAAQAATGDTFPGITISGASGNTWGDTFGASSEAGEPGFYNGATVWYQWTAPSTGLVEFNTCWASYDSVLSVWVGDDVSSLSLIAGNDDYCGLSSGIWFNTIAGTTYHLRVNGYWWGQEGSFPLNWGFHYVSDPDTDGDGLGDSSDPCPNDVGNDADGDGLCESDDPCPVDAANDADGDGLCESDDACPVDAANDADGDGLCESDDPCPASALNDADGDGTCDTAPPVTKAECKNDGWMTFNNPSFRNQGQCVSFVESAR